MFNALRHLESQWILLVIYSVLDFTLYAKIDARITDLCDLYQFQQVNFAKVSMGISREMFHGEI